MIKKSSITSVQLILMAVGSALMFPLTIMSVLSIPPANQDSWIVLLLMIPYILVINLPILVVINRFRGMNINEVLESILGKFFGKAAAFLFVFFFFFCFTACTLVMVKFLTLHILTQTPSWALLLYVLLPVCYASWNGAGVVARLAYFIVPFMILVVLLFFLLGANKMDLNNLRPILADSTFQEINSGAFFNGARFTETLIFFVFSFFLHKKANLNKSYASALGLYGITYMITLLSTLLVLGVELATRAWNPYWVFSRQVEAYDFIQKVQSINILAWIPGSILKLTIYNYMASYTLSGIFKTKSHRGFVFPLAFIAFIICLLPFVNRSDVIELLRGEKIFPYIVLPVTFVLPIILLIVYFIRRKKIDVIIKQKQLSISAEDLKAEQVVARDQT